MTSPVVVPAGLLMVTALAVRCAPVVKDRVATCSAYEVGCSVRNAAARANQTTRVVPNENSRDCTARRACNSARWQFKTDLFLQWWVKLHRNCVQKTTPQRNSLLDDRRAVQGTQALGYCGLGSAVSPYLYSQSQFWRLWKPTQSPV